MSPSVLLPPSTRLLKGQLTKAALGSTSTTSTLWSENSRTYLAAVAPPKPPPTTSTRVRVGRGALTPAQPDIAARAASEAPPSIHSRLAIMVCVLSRVQRGKAAK